MIKAWREKNGRYSVYWDSQIDNPIVKILKREKSFWDKRRGAWIVSESTLKKIGAEKMIQVAVGPYGKQDEVYPFVCESDIRKGVVNMIDPLTGIKHKVRINRVLGEPFTKNSKGIK